MLLSYLLKPTSDSPPARIIQGALLGRFTLLVAPETVAELRERVVLKPYLANRITQSDVQTFLADLEQLAEILPARTGEIPAVTRDRKDDYLLAQAPMQTP